MDTFTLTGVILAAVFAYLYFAGVVTGTIGLIPVYLAACLC
jgi:hypothetical protein